MQKQLQHSALALCFTLLMLAVSTQLAWTAESLSDRAIAQSQFKIRRHPNNPAGYYQLGDAYVQKSRESGDNSYLDLAEQALKKSLSLNPQQSGVRRHLAHVLASRHDFEGAAAEAQKAIALDPTDMDAHGVLGDAYLETGKPEQAEQAYKTMMTLKESLSSYSRRSGMKSLKGDASGAIADLKTAIELGKQEKQPKESIAWAQWQLGAEYYAIGKLAEAESTYLQALETYPKYYRSLAGLAQVRAAQERYPEAMELYREAINTVPMPEYVAALGDVHAKSGNQNEARKQYELVEYIGQLSALNKALYNRELAYFYADHDIKLEQGLELAQRELNYRRDIYAYDVLAWNLYKNGKFEEAQKAVSQALKLGTQDAKLHYHAGMIYQRVGEKEKARDHLRRALSINPQFHIFFADNAKRTLVELENSEEQAAAARQPLDGR
jgi:tetratricopeptide (TPR) repeat protein